MSEVATVFKFCSAAGGTAILRNNCIFVTSPLDLNDPFEMRPAWTNSHQERHRQDQSKRNSVLSGNPVFDGIPKPEKTDVNNQRGIADQHNQQVFQLLHNHYRVLSFCTEILDLNEGSNEGDEKQTLMWSHYANMFQGVCLAMDPTKINNGIKNGGYPVKYEPTRRSLPQSFYDCWNTLDRERVQMNGIEFTKDPESGFLLMEHNRKEILNQHLLEFLQYKSPVWHYEHELRMIYDLPALHSSKDYKKREFPCSTCKAEKKPTEQCHQPLYRDAIHLPPEAVRAVILGTDVSHTDVKEFLGILNESHYSGVLLYWSSLHSEKYVIQYNEDRNREYSEFIQKLNAKNVAYAKGHVRHDESSAQVLAARKTENFIMNKTTAKDRQS